MDQNNKEKRKKHIHALTGKFTLYQLKIMSSPNISQIKHFIISYQGCLTPPHQARAEREHLMFSVMETDSFHFGRSNKFHGSPPNHNLKWLKDLRLNNAICPKETAWETSAVLQKGSVSRAMCLVTLQTDYKSIMVELTEIGKCIKSLFSEWENKLLKLLNLHGNPCLSRINNLYNEYKLYIRLKTYF